MKNTNIIMLVFLSFISISVSASVVTDQESGFVAEIDESLKYDNIFNPQKDDRIKLAAICFLQGEQTSGFNKICYYDCLGSTFAITISSIKLCPLTIQN